MRGGKVGNAKNLPIGWNSNLDRFIIKWWLEKALIETDDSGAWIALKADLYSYAKIHINTCSLQNNCVNNIDPMLDTIFAGILQNRAEWGLLENMDLAKKLEILGKRLVCVKEQLAERQMKIPFDVEPKRIQSKLSFSAGVRKSPSVAAALPDNKSSQATPSSSYANLSRKTQLNLENRPDSTTPGGKRHKLQFDEILPMEFKTDKEGAESVDVKGLVLPKQIFDGQTFYLLQDVSDYVGRGLYHYQMYLVKLHGGTVVERRRDIREDTMFIAPESGELTDTCKNRMIYRPSIIIEHVKRQEYISKDSMKSHVWRDYTTEGSNPDVKLLNVKVEKNFGDEELIDLTLSDEEQIVETSTREKCPSPVDSQVSIKKEDDKQVNPDKKESLLVMDQENLNTGTSTEEGQSAGENNSSPGKVAKQQKIETEETEENETPIVDQEDIMSGTETISELRQESTPTKDELDVSFTSKQSASWSDEQKRQVQSLVFRCCPDGSSAMQICREAAKHFEEATGNKIPAETIRSRFKRLGRSGSFKQVFTDLKDEFLLTNEMWQAFSRFFIQKDAPFVTQNEDNNDKEDENARGIGLIDDYVKKL